MSNVPFCKMKIPSDCCVWQTGFQLWNLRIQSETGSAADACVIAQRSQNEVCFLGSGESIAAEGFGDGVDYYYAKTIKKMLNLREDILYYDI